MASDKKVIADLPDVLKEIPTLSLHDQDASELYPILYSLLASRYTNGKLSYEGSRVSFQEFGSQYQVTINNSTSRRSCNIIVTSLGTMWDEVETALKNKTAVWTHDYETKKRARNALDPLIE